MFLIGEDVWKVKRPVDFGFLDFRTVQARRRFCESEVHLNRRLAPGVYLGVEPVRRSEQGHTIAGAGPIVDWAVHMRRLPDDAAADVLLARGALDGAMLGALAERLASFFASARLAPELGRPAVLAANVAENFAQVRPFVGEIVDWTIFEEVEEFQTAFLRAERDLFEARIEAGRIREGHGDIRLEHVYFLDGEHGDDGHLSPVVIDCIEFSERFRCGDIAGDAAFLAMELEGARRPDSGGRLPRPLRGGERRFLAVPAARLLPVVLGLGAGQGRRVRGRRPRGGVPPSDGTNGKRPGGASPWPGPVSDLPPIPPS